MARIVAKISESVRVGFVKEAKLGHMFLAKGIGILDPSTCECLIASAFSVIDVVDDFGLEGFRQKADSIFLTAPEKEKREAAQRLRSRRNSGFPRSLPLG
jgi:hypothetical protein